MQMQEIESRAKVFASARDELASRLQDLRDEQESAKRRRIQGIKNSLARFTAAHGELKEAIEVSKDEFKSPKTRVLHGIKVGWMKQRGKLEIGDADNVVRLIRKLLPDQAETLIKTTDKPVAAALSNLAAGDLKRLGVRIADDIDAVVLKPVDGELDKLIAALINDEDVEAVQA
ncbi:MAG: hypothetical protein J0H50_10615 [Xanthomonadales bacterium]|nr:hypothetical protein [Xanthomonadales bacterium]